MNEEGGGDDSFEGADLSRVHEFIASVQRGEGTAKDPRQKTRGGFFPGLTAQPWHAWDGFASTAEVTRILEGEAPVIIEEFLGASKREDFLVDHPASNLHPLLKPMDWGYFQVWRSGQFGPRARDLLPRTCAVMDKLMHHLAPAGEVAFHNMLPGARLRPHADGPNTTLTCHLGIKIPPNCALRVAGEARTWEEGRCLWFDHSYEHDAWNESTENRVILLHDIIHPDITPDELRYWRAMYRR